MLHYKIWTLLQLHFSWRRTVTVWQIQSSHSCYSQGQLQCSWTVTHMWELFFWVNHPKVSSQETCKCFLNSVLLLPPTSALAVGGKLHTNSYVVLSSERLSHMQLWYYFYTFASFSIFHLHKSDYVQCCQNPVICKGFWSGYAIFVKLALSQRTHWLHSVTLHAQRASKLSSCLQSGVALQG